MLINDQTLQQFVNCKNFTNTHSHSLTLTLTNSLKHSSTCPPIHSLTHPLSHSLIQSVTYSLIADHKIYLLPKPLCIWPSFLPREKFIIVCTKLSYYCAIYFHPQGSRKIKFIGGITPDVCTSFITNKPKPFIYSPRQLFFKHLEMHMFTYATSTFITKVLHLVTQV